MDEKILFACLMSLLFIGWLLFLLRVYADEHERQRGNQARLIMKTALFGGLAALLYVVPFLSFPLPFLPPFLKFHFDEIAIFIAGFSSGPGCAFGAIIIKTLIKLPFTETLAVGEISDLIYSSVFVLPAAFIYRRRRDLPHALLGMVIGLLLQLVVSVILNIYVMIPFYMFVMGFSKETLLALMQAANTAIKDVMWGYGLLAVLPFNLLKDVIILLITLTVYKSVHRLIDRL